MIDEVGTVRSPIVAGTLGWVSVHGERWRAVVAFVPGQTESGEYEPVVEVGRKVTVVGLGDEAVVEVVPAEWLSRRSVIGTKD
jgi:membrane-bound ClpP family serine protease